MKSPNCHQAVLEALNGVEPITRCDSYKYNVLLWQLTHGQKVKVSTTRMTPLTRMQFENIGLWTDFYALRDVVEPEIPHTATRKKIKNRDIFKLLRMFALGTAHDEPYEIAVNVLEQIGDEICWRWSLHNVYKIIMPYCQNMEALDVAGYELSGIRSYSGRNVQLIDDMLTYLKKKSRRNG
jgi:hypothetical protein